jgi:hypothetical protein
VQATSIALGHREEIGLEQTYRMTKPAIGPQRIGVGGLPGWGAHWNKKQSSVKVVWFRARDCFWILFSLLLLSWMGRDFKKEVQIGKDFR